MNAINYLALLLIIMVYLVSAKNCCSYDDSGIPGGCSSKGTTYKNITYYCIDTTAGVCDDCEILDSVNDIDQCTSCCAEEDYSCGGLYSFLTSTSWSMLAIVFLASCCCCSIMLFTVEDERVKEGVTFHEAYLLPIPMVDADLDFDDKDDMTPPDQPTAVAREQTGIDVTVAEPTEFSSLVHYQPETRNNLFWT